MKYMVVINTSNGLITCSIELEKKVNTFIANGWKPLGGISVSKSTDCIGMDNIVMAQAMIKE